MTNCTANPALRLSVSCGLVQDVAANQEAIRLPKVLCIVKGEDLSKADDGNMGRQ